MAVILVYIHRLLFVHLFCSDLQVLEGVIKYRWNALPVEQRDGMKNYISEVIVQVLTYRILHWIIILHFPFKYVDEICVVFTFFFQLSSNEASLRMERLYINKLNIILVQVRFQIIHLSVTCSGAMVFPPNTYY